MIEPKTPSLAGRQHLTWPQAVEVMRAGKYVRRASQMYLKLVQVKGDDGGENPWSEVAVYESGQEGCYLAYAWSVKDEPVRIFMGASSKVPFVPESEHFDATDWVVVDKHET